MNSDLIVGRRGWIDEEGEESSNTALAVVHGSAEQLNRSQNTPCRHRYGRIT